MILHVQKSHQLTGTVSMPRSKTHSFRALILASLADGTSTICNPKISSDWHKAVEAMILYGAEITEIKKDTFQVKGVAGKPTTPSDILDVKNSGTMLAYLMGVAGACPGYSIITGDSSIRNLRKISKNTIKPFQELGVEIISTKKDGMAPFVIKGPVQGGVAHANGEGCQPIFSLLVASSLSQKPVTLHVSNPGETAYIDSLLYWFKTAKVSCENVGGTYTKYHFPGNSIPQPFDVEIPYEWSTPSYPLLSALLVPQSELVVKDMDFNDPYGDKFVTFALQQMGGDIEIKGRTLTARTSDLHGIEIDMNNMPDQLPTIAVAACFAKGKTIIKNTEVARWKECDRIAAMCQELTKMGAKIEEKQDGLIIDQDGSWKLHCAEIDGHHDHRIVMAFAIAGMMCEGETKIIHAEYVKKSFSNFFPEMQSAGAKFTLESENSDHY